MQKIRILLADHQYLIFEGLRSLVSELPGFELAGHAYCSSELQEMASRLAPDLIVLDFTSAAFSVNDLSTLKKRNQESKILGLTADTCKTVIRKAVDQGLRNYVLKDCSREEILDAIKACAAGEKFFCGKIVDALVTENEETRSSTSCEALNVSDRELEIIRLIAEGHSNKEIAEKLYLSLHTINTHRKNIMAKLSVNNTAGIVLFAVREQIISPNKYLFSN